MKYWALFSGLRIVSEEHRRYLILKTNSKIWFSNMWRQLRKKFWYQKSRHIIKNLGIQTSMGRSRQGCSKNSQENYESSHVEIGKDFSCNTLKQKWGALLYFHRGLYTPSLICILHNYNVLHQWIQWQNTYK